MPVIVRAPKVLVIENIRITAIIKNNINENKKPSKKRRLSNYIKLTQPLIKASNYQLINVSFISQSCPAKRNN
jgi:hypothetical protein